MSNETIWIVTDDAPQMTVPDGQKGGIDPVRTIHPPATSEKGVRVSVDKLEQEMTNFLHIVGRLFHRAEQQAVEQKPGMQLDEIELSVEISASGEVKLIGSGVKADGKGAIKLKFKRVKPKILPS
ncbi:MAG: hypothetical protein HC866_01860 [Leptolyngbyaceae cyanobacterium RU_5_1]|nr:hypothetical protein [Leptolyngbyaceae cyanobacterium RU_5_1]